MVGFGRWILVKPCHIIVEFNFPPSCKVNSRLLNVGKVDDITNINSKVILIVVISTLPTFNTECPPGLPYGGKLDDIYDVVWFEHVHLKFKDVDCVLFGFRTNEV